MEKADRDSALLKGFKYSPLNRTQNLVPGNVLNVSCYDEKAFVEPGLQG
jgi:hypothetical protein